MYYAADTSHSGVSGENAWLVTNKRSAARDSFLFVCPCFTLPFTVSAVKCQTVCDLPTGAVHAIQRVLQTFAHKLWVGKETSDNIHLLGEPLSAVILGCTDSCRAKRLRHTYQTMKKGPTLGSNLDKCLKSALGNVSRWAPSYEWVSGRSKLCEWCTDLSAENTGRLNNVVDCFLPYLIHSDRGGAPTGLGWQPWVKTKIMSSHKNVNCPGREINQSQHLSWVWTKILVFTVNNQVFKTDMFC